MFILPEKSFSYSQFEPHIDAQTMETHYSKHHAGYVSKLNAALSSIDHPECEIEDLFSEIEKYPSSVRNNAGGHYNHTLFWSSLTTDMTAPRGLFADAILDSFGGIQEFKKEFESAAASVFGSGWAWLVLAKDGSLKITTTVNQDNPLMSDIDDGFPLLALDVWEHAYYLNYQNRRPDYIQAFWSLVNWDRVSERFANKTKLVDMLGQC